jgi:DNA helicase-2/ATP-dependent DNA helicase PcrA
LISPQKDVERGTLTQFLSQQNRLKKARNAIQNFMVMHFNQKGISPKTRNLIDQLKSLFYDLLWDKIRNDLDEQKMALPTNQFAEQIMPHFLKILRQSENSTEKFEKKKADIEKIINWTKDYETISEYLADISLITNPTNKEPGESLKKEDVDRITISSIHQFKGLERRVIFLPTLMNEIFPNKKSLKDSNELEEERRIFYVACTRAMDLLYFSYPITLRDKKNGEPSQFLQEVCLPNSNFVKISNRPDPSYPLFSRGDLEL